MDLIKRSILIVAALLLAGAAGAQAQTIDLGPDRTGVTASSEGLDALRFQIEIGELEAITVTTPEGPFTRLMIPGQHASKEIGGPELPMINRLFEIPYEARVRVEILSVESRDIDLAALGISHRLMPAQPSMPKNADPATWPFVFEPERYTVERVARDLVTTAELGRLRGIDLGRFELSPVEYFPLQNRIRVHERVDVRLVFEGADHASGDALKARTSSPFFEVVYRTVEGYRGLPVDYPDRVRDVVTLVIVTPPEFESLLQDFASWKTERGFHTVVAVTGTPEVGTTKEQIRTYIHNLYNNPTPDLPAPSFVIFVGDVAQMPTFFESGDATDRPYCAVDGDLVPDIYYGRFSATNPSQLQAILDKTLMYDQFTMPDPSYLGEVVMIGGMDSNFGQVWANGQINYGTSLYFNASHGILSHTYLYPQSGSQASAIIQNVSDGVAYVNYTAHGSETSWSNPYFGQSDVNGLANAGQYCLAVGNCCLTSTYDYPECFAETWLRAANKGAIGYIGGSNSTYWDEDYWWGVGYGQVVQFPTYEQNGLGAYDGLFHDHGEPMDQWYVTNDAIIFCGNLAVMESGSGLTTYYWNIYNLMGDPSISTYLGVPSANPVVHPATIFTTASSITVEAVPNSYVGLTQNGALIAAGTVDATGSLELTIPEVLTPGTAKLVVTAQNKRPYVTDLNVIIPAVVVINPTSIDAGVPTLVTVSVYEADGVTPKPGIEVWAEGLDYTTAPVVTAADGSCSFTVNYPFGPSIDICGHQPGEAWMLFREPLEVNATALVGVILSVSTDIGLVNTFPVNLPGTLSVRKLGGGALPPHTLWAFLNAEPGVSTTGDNLVFTADAPGEVRGVFAAPGYDLVSTVFPAIVVYGTLAGNVTAGSSPAVGARVRGWLDGEVVFEAVTNASGSYSVTGDIVVDTYVVTCDFFGYLHWEDTCFVDYGANTLDIAMEAAPSGILSGTVTEAGTGTPLLATVSVYRSDDQSLYDEVQTNPIAGGAYTTGALPFFDYLVVVSSQQHATDSLLVTVDEPAETQDFALERVFIEEPCRSPGLAIPDNNPTGVQDQITIGFGGTIQDISVYVNITHTYIGDLQVKLTSPEGTMVMLHDRSGGTTENIIGWYPEDLTPAQSLDAFLGEDMQGTWTLRVADLAGYDTGTLNSWCLRITYEETVGVTDPGERWVFALERNVPNPFNPVTRIDFEVPSSGGVRLSVFDVRGRLVRTLVDRVLPAGRHAAIWDGRDDGGRAAGSGVYYYRLEAEGGGAQTRRMTLLK